MPEKHNDCLFSVSQYSKSFLYIKQLSPSFNVHDYAYSFPHPANVLLLSTYFAVDQHQWC